MPKWYIVHAWAGDFHRLAQSLKRCALALDGRGG